MKNICKNCRYWEKTSDILGECRIDPPKTRKDNYFDNFSFSNILKTAFWPKTDNLDWCNEFKEISQQTTTSVNKKTFSRQEKISCK